MSLHIILTYFFLYIDFNLLDGRGILFDSFCDIVWYQIEFGVKFRHSARNIADWVNREELCVYIWAGVSKCLKRDKYQMSEKSIRLILTKNTIC